MSIESRCWSVRTLAETVCVVCSSRSESVVFPWSTCAMMQKFLVSGAAIVWSGGEVRVLRKALHLPCLVCAPCEAGKDSARPELHELGCAGRGGRAHAILP